MRHRQRNVYQCAQCVQEWWHESDTIGGLEECPNCQWPSLPIEMVDDPECECAACTSWEASERYTGWDRIHDGNRAEGRPIGDQWPHRGAS